MLLHSHVLDGSFEGISRDTSGIVLYAIVESLGVLMLLHMY